MSRWDEHAQLWRHPTQIISHWADADLVPKRLLHHRSTGQFWETIAAAGITLLVTREYEHFVVALTVRASGPYVTYLPMPHPSGIAVDRRRERVLVASTRNPNQLFELAPATQCLPGRTVPEDNANGRSLVPLRSRILPGALYLHDLAIIDDALHANAVGQNTVIRIEDDGSFETVWWPRCIERNGHPLLDRNYIQLNSIAAGPSLGESFFTASSAALSSRRPGHRNYPVDGRGVIFSGATRDICVRGLTRPHSARLHGGRVWVDNSGYGELVSADPNESRYDVITRLPGWTRGLSFTDDVAFVGTSRVIPRFQHYAPGLTQGANVCGVHAVSLDSGRILGSCVWPRGDQIFAVDWIPNTISEGFPFAPGVTARDSRAFFYSFTSE
jgi:uncharacterized protein (TIGR03032 family)